MCLYMVVVFVYFCTCMCAIIVESMNVCWYMCKVACRGECIVASNYLCAHVYGYMCSRCR